MNDSNNHVSYSDVESLWWVRCNNNYLPGHEYIPFTYNGYTYYNSGSSVKRTQPRTDYKAFLSF